MNTLRRYTSACPCRCGGDPVLLTRQRYVRPLQAGFTLLELVLTLAMSVVLMALVGGAIQFYGRDMDLRNMDVRQTQLAAALIQMMENDLRGCVYGQPTDMQPLQSLLASMDDDDDQETDTDDPATQTDDGDEDSGATSESSGRDLLTSTAVLGLPGLVGDAVSIQIDLSRMPRLEEYQIFLGDSFGDLDDIPSDVKTVSYYVQAEGTIAGVRDSLEAVSGGPLGADRAAGGLVRRSLDRAANVFALTSGTTAALSQSGDLLATEVTAISFEYFDGISWLTDWNSDEVGRLPSAVRISVTMNDASVATENALRTFTHVVQLPLARPAETATETEPEFAPARPEPSTGSSDESSATGGSQPRQTASGANS